MQFCFKREHVAIFISCPRRADVDFMGSCGISLLVCLDISSTLKKTPLVLRLNFAAVH